jgi:sialate O-acetylesterase
MKRTIPYLPLLTLLTCLTAPAEVTLPALFSDHMVIQRNLPVHVWGRATPGEAVAVTFQSGAASATADSLGFWSVRLPALDAGGPFTLTVKGANTITLRDVLVGDVWVASGQSNMELRLRDALNGPGEIVVSNYPKIRFLQVANQTSPYPLDNVNAGKGWLVSSPETSGSLSAVAYFFARDLQSHEGVPIGLLSSSWGGTPQEAWVSLKTISADASLMPVFASWAKMNEDVVAEKLRREIQLKAWQDAVNQAKAEGKTPPGRPYKGNDSGEWAPGGLFNAMIAPLTPYPIRGAIWYQGESNADAEHIGVYGRLIEAMIQDWRRAWGQGDFPFLLVQLPGYKNGNRWPEARDAQRRALSLANTGMAITIDLGEPTNIHPKNKQDVGKRLALVARGVADGEKIEYSGPLFRLASAEGSSIRVWFDHVGTGLTAKDGPLKAFEVAGADRRFKLAQATIDGATVVVSSSAVPAPLYVRYAWSDFPDCNLYNSEGLPASPFQSEK